MKKFSLLCLMILATMSPINATEKIYIDKDEMKTSQDAFHIHLGNNVWIETNTVHRDITGFYTFEGNLAKGAYKGEYKKTWKCPYCYNYWPIGTPCQNKDCPSKYK